MQVFGQLGNFPQVKAISKVIAKRTETGKESKKSEEANFRPDSLNLWIESRFVEFCAGEFLIHFMLLYCYPMSNMSNSLKQNVALKIHKFLVRNIALILEGQNGCSVCRSTSRRNRAPGVHTDLQV